MLMSLSAELDLSPRKSSSGKVRDVGKVCGVRFADTPAFACGGRARGAKLRGLKYEARVLDWLVEGLGQTWIPFKRQWLIWTDAYGEERYVQPDFFALDTERGKALLVEVKLTRVPKAWYQLNKQYLPVLRHILPSFSIAMLEVASKVCAVDVPEKVRVIHSLRDIRYGATSFMKVDYGR